MSADVIHASYPDLGRILEAQQPAPEAHDKLLFIIVHQASEPWLKLCLHKLIAARECIEADNLLPAFKMLARVARTQQQLIQSWDVLSTMTPNDYSAIRPHLGASSGFQSVQYRMMGFMLGGRDGKHVRLHKSNEDWAARPKEERGRASLYDAAIRLLARRGFAIDVTPAERDPTTPYLHNASVEAAWAVIYREPETHWDLYELAEKLADLESHFQGWRFGHLKTVERIIGFKRGTGGTPGAPYLEGVLKQAFCPELLSVRTAI